MTRSRWKWAALPVGIWLIAEVVAAIVVFGRQGAQWALLATVLIVAAFVVHRRRAAKVTEGQR